MKVSAGPGRDAAACCRSAWAGRRALGCCSATRRRARYLRPRNSAQPPLSRENMTQRVVLDRRMPFAGASRIRRCPGPCGRPARRRRPCGASSQSRSVRVGPRRGFGVARRDVPIGGSSMPRPRQLLVARGADGVPAGVVRALVARDVLGPGVQRPVRRRCRRRRGRRVRPSRGARSIMRHGVVADGVGVVVVVALRRATSVSCCRIRVRRVEVAAAAAERAVVARRSRADGERVARRRPAPMVRAGWRVGAADVPLART